jgi:oxygen-dependent protoporphyrinogen oxidase
MGALVIGGGITGLAAARCLAIAGTPVTLLEAGPRLGGKIATERVDGFLLEHGPDSFLATRPAAVALARELGLGHELVGTRDPRAVFIRRDGVLVPMPEGLGLVLPTRVMPFARSRLFSWPEKARMARDLVSPRLLGPDDIAVGTYLRRRLGSPLVDRLAGPLVGGVYGTPIDELSLDAVVPQLRTAEAEHRSLLRAGLADGRKQREMAAKRPPGTKPLGVFQSLRGGMGTLVDALADSLAVAGADVRTGVRVRALSRAGLGVAARLGDGSLERFEAVVIATPAPVAVRLLDAEIPGAAAALETIPHGTSILVTLAYPRSAVARELVGHGYLVPPTEGGAISACTWSSEKWEGRAPGDSVLLRMFVRDEGTWTSLPEADLVAAARTDAERTLQITGEPLLVRVSRWDGAMPRYTVGHLARATAVEEAVSAWPAVTVAGASYRGVGLPDCITSGLAAATRMGEWLSGHPEPAPDPSPAAASAPAG